MGSKMVLDRQKSSSTVQSAGNGYEDKMATGMADIFGAEAEPATRTLLKLSVFKLKSDTESMIRADDANLNETSDDSRLLTQRDEDSANVNAHLVDIREASETVYGPDFTRELGFEGDTPRDPVAVQRLGVLVLRNLGSGSTPPPKPIKVGLSMDLGAWKKPLATGLEELAHAIQAVSDDKRDADQTLVDKREAMGRYDRTFSTTANLISHMLRAAGEMELATRVRPSTRKPGQTIEDSKEEIGSEPAQ